MKNQVIIAVMLLSLCGNTLAQQPLKLSLQDAQKYALEHNRTLKNATLDIQKAEASRWQTLSTLMPQINASVDYSNMLGYKLNMMGFNIAMPPYATIGITSAVAVSAPQIIGIQMQKLSATMSDITLKKTELKIKNQVKSIYHSILVMEETVTLLEKNLTNMQKMLQHTENSVKVGLLEQTDADKLSVQIVSMKTSINSVKRSLEMLYNAMRLQLGIGVNQEITLTQSIIELLDIEKAKSLEKLGFTLDNNYNFQLLKQGLEISKKQVDLKKWSYAPSLSAFHSYSHKKYFSNEPTMNMTPPNVVGLSLKVPIFSSGNRYMAIKEAELEYKKQLNVMEDTQEALVIQHRQLRFNLESALESFENQKKNIEVNQRIFDNISRKYEQGMVSSLEVTNIGTNLILAQNNYVKSLMDVVAAQIELEELINTDN